MATARFSRREQADLCRVAQAFKASDDVGQSQIDVAFHILEDDPDGPDLVDDAGNVRP